MIMTGWVKFETEIEIDMDEYEKLGREIGVYNFLKSELKKRGIGLDKFKVGIIEDEKIEVTTNLRERLESMADEIREILDYDVKGEKVRL